MDHVESELYTIKTQFYTYQYQKVIDYSIEQFSEESRFDVLVFQIRSIISLGEDASSIIENSKANFPEKEETFQLLQACNDLNTFGTDDSTYFEDIVNSKTGPSSELQAVLTAVYLVKVTKNIDQAIQLLEKYAEKESSSKSTGKVNLELSLVLIQLYFVKGNYTLALKEYNRVKFNAESNSAKDSIIYQVLESFVLSILGGSDNINNAYYFYDEILSSDFDNDPQGKFRLLNSIFALTLQLKHYPEATELLAQIETLKVAHESSDFVANKITADYLINNGSNVEDLLKQLKSIDSEHQLLSDLEEKNINFDEIVEKYQSV